ncbi:MAG: NAD-dependent epimerase/dehydratase family protein, partial [Elusimicrobia bacterium]|nr:NAD-dependent epimerase/dehydratase family protein [Elusimicrobiota bacterium]
MPDLAFVTGATGFVGANLARSLLAKGLRVRALARPRSDRRALAGLDVEVAEGDLLDPASLERAARGARWVFHVAADYRIWVPDPEAMLRANVEGTENVLAAAGKAGAERIVHCSSVAAVKVRADGAPADETSRYEEPSGIVGVYKRSKWLSERAALR